MKLITYLKTLAALKNSDFVELTGGFRNEVVLAKSNKVVYKFNSGNEPVILKFLSKNQYKHSLSLKSQNHTIYGVEYLEDTYNLFELITEDKLSIALLSEIYFQIGQALKELHSLPIDKFENKFKFKSIPRKINFIDKGITKVVLNYIDKLDFTNLVISHGDFGPQQVILKSNNKNFKIIDWEDSCLTHPYFDVASFLWTTRFHFPDIYHPVSNLFIAGYFGKDTVDSDLLKAFSVLRIWTSLKNFEESDEVTKVAWVERLKLTLSQSYTDLVTIK